MEEKPIVEERGYSVLDEYCKQFHHMETELTIIKSENKELTERNKKLAEEFQEAKEQSCKQIQNMKAELGRSDSVNRELDKRNKNLEEELHKAKEQCFKQFLDMQTILVKTRSQNKELAHRNDKLEEELHKAKVNEQLSERNHEQTRNKLKGWCTALAAMKEECDGICQQQEYSGAATQLSKRKKYVLKIYEINDYMNCPLCLKAWNPSGEHNVCSLSCGHFFGRSCITQWINKTGTRGSSTCPLCSSKATLKEIRNHCASQTLEDI